MDREDFIDCMSVKINKYIRLSEMMLVILTELKESLLIFDTKRLNRVLDEKLVLSEELLVVNNEINAVMCKHYGGFSEEATSKMLAEYPLLKNNWETLRQFVKNIKTMLVDVRRVLVSIEKYNENLLKNINIKKKPGYSRAVSRYNKGFKKE